MASTDSANTKVIQLDLFLPIPDFSDIALRDYQETMQRPFFSLSKNKRVKPIEYQSPDGKVSVHVSANPSFGMATIWDADVLLFLASAIQEQKRKGLNDISPTLRIHPGHLLKRIGRSPGGKDYQRLLSALDRLQSTTIKTNLRSEKRRETVFSWIDSYSHLVNDEDGTSLGMEITMSRWFYEGILDADSILAINPAYFDLTGGLERVLYRIGRKHAGGNGPAGFSISLDTLWPKSGSESSFRRFKFEVMKIVRENALPDLHLEITDEATRPKLRFVVRSRDTGTLPSSGSAAAPRVAPAKGVRAAPTQARDGAGTSRPISKFAEDEVAPEVLAQLRSECPGLDLDAMKALFDGYIKRSPDNLPANYDRRFYGFVVEHFKRNAGQLGLL
jgi:plasmid replication initiation protein